MARVRLSEPQQSALECRWLEDGGPGGDGTEAADEAALQDAWDGGEWLEFEPTDAEAVFRALRDASNAEDAFQQDASNDPDLRRLAGRAARSLAALSGRVLRCA